MHVFRVTLSVFNSPWTKFFHNFFFRKKSIPLDRVVCIFGKSFWKKGILLLFEIVLLSTVVANFSNWHVSRSILYICTVDVY